MTTLSLLLLTIGSTLFLRIHFLPSLARSDLYKSRAS